jgi:hypothetical protein
MEVTIHRRMGGKLVDGCKKNEVIFSPPVSPNEQ